MTRFPLQMKTLRKTALAAAALAALTPYATAQQDAQLPVLELEEVVVIGQAARIQSALEKQRDADSIESVVHADAIAQLPDDNVAEAVQRLPGVSVERDQGEGRFVTVRGLGPDLNAVTINGTLIPAPETDRRAVALDVLPASLVQSLSIVKTPTPDMDANSLGATIAVESLSAFDHETPLRTVTVEASHDDNSGKNSPKISGAFTQRFKNGDGKDVLGVAAAFSWHNRKFGSDNVETGGAWDFDEEPPLLEEVEERRYDITRERTGLGVNFDLRPNRDTKVWLRSLYSRFEDTETRQALAAEFDDPLAAGQRGVAETERGLKDRVETQKIGSVVLGGERLAGLWTISGQAGYSRAQEENPNYLGADYKGDEFDDVGFDSSRRPYLRGSSDFRDLSNYTLDKIELEQSKTTDTEKNVKLDLSREYEIGSHAGQIKFGGKISRRTKTNKAELWEFEDFGDHGYSDDDLNLANLGTGAGRLKQIIKGLDRDEFYNEEESRINDFRIKEDINSAYVMNTLDIDALRIIAGLRYEGTRLKARGTSYDDENESFQTENANKKYNNWLPGLHLRYQLAPVTQVRAAWTNSVVRPTFGQLAPGFAFDGEEAEFGNPHLKPMKSSNFDLGIEHYFDRAGVVSAHVFYKRINNFIYQTDVAGTAGSRWEDYDEAITFANGNRAKVYGLELAWSQKFRQLPAPFNGLLAGVNLTFSKSDARISGMADGELLSRKISLPNQSDTVGNLMLGWENDKLSLRLSGNYKSKYLMEVAGIDSPRSDLYSDSQFFLDFSASYRLNKAAQVYFQVQNITDEPYYVYVGSRRYNAQYEKYGPTYKLGLTLNF